MKAMNFEKGQKYEFKVLASHRVGTTLYYTIEANGMEHSVKAYEFQKRQAPTTISCICKGVNEYGKPAFMQDIASLISQLYKVGDVADFRIKTQPGGTRDFYEVTDENDFCFRLVGYGNEKYYNRQMVRCRITYINMVRVEMEPATGCKVVYIPFYDVEKLLSLDPDNNADHDLIRHLLKLPIFLTARKRYNDGNPLWVIKVLKTVYENLDSLLMANNKELKVALLKSYYNILKNLLENSDYLNQAAENESAQYQNELGIWLQKTRNYLDAIEIMEQGTADAFVMQAFSNLHTSGYIINPVERMQKVICIFALSHCREMRRYVEEIFEVVREQHENTRFLRVFSKSLVKMLVTFIKRLVNHSRNRFTSDDKERIELIIRCLALRLLLSSNEAAPDPDYKLYQAMLYRYAASLISDPERVQSLTYKAFEALFDSFSRSLGFEWNNIFDVTELCDILADSTPALSSAEPETFIFARNNVKIKMRGHQLSLEPEKHEHELQNVVPDDIFTSTKVQVKLDCKLPEPAPELNPLEAMQYLWNEIYRVLFNKEPEEASGLLHAKRMPKPGDEVFVRIVGKSAVSPYEYVCRIEDDEYWGSGLINPTKQIVSYNVHVTPDCFVDPTTGKSFLLKATVERIDPNGNINFSMRKGIANFNRETLDLDAKNLVVVSRVDQHQYLCITRGGVTMFIPRKDNTPILRLNDFLVADIIAIVGEGNVQGEIVGRAYETFDRTEAFRNLISDYAEGRVYEGSDIEPKDEDAGKAAPTPMPADYVRELVWVIERKGMMQSSLPIIYSYMALAHIMARVLGDSKLEAYFKRRLEMLMMMDNFNSKGAFDQNALSELQRDSHDLTELFPELRESIMRLRILNCFDDKESAGFLWDELNHGKDDKTRRMAGMVLAHNLLADKENEAFRENLRSNLYSLLKIQHS